MKQIQICIAYRCIHCTGLFIPGKQKHSFIISIIVTWSFKANTIRYAIVMFVAYIPLDLWYSIKKLHKMKRRLLQFLKSTSVKGMSRIICTKSSFLRTVWSICVVSFLSVAFYLTYLLTKGYLEYASVISLREYNLDLTGTTSDALRLPDITFCNLNPFAVSTHNLTNIPSLEAYHQRAMDMTACDGCSPEQQKALRELRIELLTTSGYYIHIGASKAKTISHTQDQFIVSCTVGMLSGMHPRRVPCEGVTTVVPYYDYMYYNCFTLKLPPGNRTVRICMVVSLWNYS